MDAKIQRCGGCGQSYIAKSARSKFCGPACRMRAHRAGGVEAPTVTSSQSAPEWGRVFAATMAELQQAHCEGSAVGTAVLMIARQLDGDVPAAARAALTKELRASLAEVLRDASAASVDQDADNPIAFLRARAEERRGRAG